MPDSSDPQKPINTQGMGQAPPVPPVPPVPPSAPLPGYGPIYPAPPAGRGIGAILSRVMIGLISTVLLFSIMLNVYLGIFFASSMAGPMEMPQRGSDASIRIVIIPIQGMIDSQMAAFVNQAIWSLRDNIPSAVVLRIDSGGGGVTASDQIWHALDQFKKDTGVPVVASLGAMAASGGYYIASVADHIVIEPTTITGSIGVIAQAFTVEKMLEKVGVTPEVIVATRSTKKDTLSPFRAWTENDRGELRFILDQAHDRFIQIVAQGRVDLEVADVQRLATGEPYTAAQALENKLADSEGYIEAALSKAKALAKLSDASDPQILLMKPSHSLGILGLMGVTSPFSQQVDAQTLRRWLGQMTVPRVEYRVAPLP